MDASPITIAITLLILFLIRKSKECFNLRDNLMMLFTTYIHFKPRFDRSEATSHSHFHCFDCTNYNRLALGVSIDFTGSPHSLSDCISLTLSPSSKREEENRFVTSFVLFLSLFFLASQIRVILNQKYNEM